MLQQQKLKLQNKIELLRKGNNMNNLKKDSNYIVLHKSRAIKNGKTSVVFKLNGREVYFSYAVDDVIYLESKYYIRIDLNSDIKLYNNATISNNTLLDVITIKTFIERYQLPLLENYL